MKMKITVEIENADGSKEIKPIVIDTEIPEFEEFKSPDNFREVFHKYETAVLKARNMAAELATEEYLSELSKKKITTEAEGRDGVTINEDDSRYKLETEIGRIEVVTHRVEKGSRTVFNTKVDVFPKVGPNERYRSSCYDNLELRLVTFMSYRKTEEVMNHLRWQDDDDLIKSRTLADAVVREGAKITDYLEAKAKQILIQHQFDEKSGKPKELHALETVVEYSKIPTFSSDEVTKVIDEYNDGKEKERQIDATQINEVFENPAHSVNISVDDVV